MDTPEQRVFVAEARPHFETLLEFARRELLYYQRRGAVAADELKAEQVAGEALLRAFRDRDKRPAGLPFRSWLLGTEQRVLGRLLNDGERHKDLWSLSEDRPLPGGPPPADDDVFWDWYQPEERQRWNDVTPPGALPEDLESTSLGLEPRLRRPWVLHDGYGLSIPEIAAVLRVREETVVEWIRAARARLEQPAARGGTTWNGDALG